MLTGARGEDYALVRSALEVAPSSVPMQRPEEDGKPPRDSGASGATSRDSKPEDA